MLTQLRWLGLEGKSLDTARQFYEDELDLTVTAVDERECRLAAGPTELRLRRPVDIPRGGVHTHFAFSIPHEEYDDWYDRLSSTHELEEHSFGTAKSLYCYDPDGNCVELGQQTVEGPGIVGIFEVVLEVRDLDRARACYEALGFELADRGSARKRVRLSGPMALELWEPHLGLADARGGLHVDLGFETDAPQDAADRIAEWTRDRTDSEEGVRVTDADGHVVHFVEPESPTSTGSGDES
jgi:catechol 2,3-dioxygenase-like lactoylglutathione lyase family enzyme